MDRFEYKILKETKRILLIDRRTLNEALLKPTELIELSKVLQSAMFAYVKETGCKLIEDEPDVIYCLTTTKPLLTTEEMKKWIDGASYKQLLELWRFAPVGSPFFEGELGDYYAEVMKRKGEEIGNDERVQASKDIGWKAK
jgi:hypothetical protein